MERGGWRRVETLEERKIRRRRVQTISDSGATDCHRAFRLHRIQAVPSPGGADLGHSKNPTLQSGVDP